MTPVTESLPHCVRDHLDPASQEVWEGQGTGRTCVVCAAVISPDQIENKSFFVPLEWQSRSGLMCHA